MNEENQNNNQIHKTEKNMFKFDGPIGRKEFIVTYAYLFFYSFIFICVYIFAFDSAYYTIGIKPFLALFIVIFLLYLIIATYISAINYIKRIYDLINDKRKSVFYTVAIFVGLTAMSFIPILNIIGIILSIIILFILLTRKGQLV